MMRMTGLNRKQNLPNVAGFTFQPTMVGNDCRIIILFLTLKNYLRGLWIKGSYVSKPTTFYRFSSQIWSEMVELKRNYFCCLESDGGNEVKGGVPSHIKSKECDRFYFLTE